MGIAAFALIIASKLFIYHLNQDSDYIAAGNAIPGSLVSFYSNGFFLGRSLAEGANVSIALPAHLIPGSRLVATETARGLRRDVALNTVANDYTTYHYDLGRTGWNKFETTLTTANVNSTSFGQLFTLPVDGNVLAQPLYVQGLSINGGTHNVAYVATENDSVYAFDADTGGSLWHTSLVNPGAGLTPLSTTDVNCALVQPVIGVTGTPVIDVTTNTIYVVAAEKQTTGQTVKYMQVLHALDLLTGNEKTGSPVSISASAKLNNGTTIHFTPRFSNQRAGLTLYKGVVYIPYSSYCDKNTTLVHGWLIGYNASTLVRNFTFATTLDTSSYYLATLWQSGYAPALNAATGSIFVATGNGPFDADTGGHNYGDTALRLSLSLAVKDYFTPYNQATLFTQDLDLGGGGMMLLPHQGGSVPLLAVAGGKDGRIFLLNQANLGKFTPGGPDKVLQEIQLMNPGGFAPEIDAGPAFFQSATTAYVYYAAEQDYLRAFALSTSPSTHLVQVGESPDIFTGKGGAIPATSSNGTTAGTQIVWAPTRPNVPGTDPIMLRAYDATNVSHELFQASAGSWLSPHGRPFMTPMVINGKVYVGNASGVAVFGLLARRAHVAGM